MTGSDGLFNKTSLASGGEPTGEDRCGSTETIKEAAEVQSQGMAARVHNCGQIRELPRI